MYRNNHVSNKFIHHWSELLTNKLIVVLLYKFHINNSITVHILSYDMDFKI